MSYSYCSLFAVSRNVANRLCSARTEDADSKRFHFRRSTAHLDLLFILPRGRAANAQAGFSGQYGLRSCSEAFCELTMRLLLLLTPPTHYSRIRDVPLMPRPYKYSWNSYKCSCNSACSSLIEIAVAISHLRKCVTQTESWKTR